MERMRQLLALGASVAAQDEQGWPALIAAAYQNNLSVTDVDSTLNSFWCIIIIIGRVLVRGTVKSMPRDYLPPVMAGVFF